VNQELFVYKNQSRELTQNNYLAVKFKGKGKNVFGLGASVHAYVDSGVLTFDNMPIRGFQSSMDYKIVMGLGNLSTIDSLVIFWPDRSIQSLTNVKANQLLTVSNADAKQVSRSLPKSTALLRPIKTDSIRHIENAFNEFDRDRLLYHMISTQGPAFAQGDINNDGLEDFFLGGSAGQSGAIYLQKPNDKFIELSREVFLPDSAAEDVSAVFFDADNDKDLDLYVATGGTEHTTQSIHQVDRLYLNQGVRDNAPIFIKATDQLPLFYQSGSCVKPGDVDGDGDLDLFVGTRVVPAYYGIPADQFILINDGKGNFKDQTVDVAPQLKQLGMVTDAHWYDHDKNGFLDLLVVGEWMPITLFMNDGKRLLKVDKLAGCEKSDGWWNRIEAADIDKDGDEDFVLGNLGLNSYFKPTAAEPISLYISDFDKNGSIEPIFVHSRDGKEFTYALRQDIIKQLTFLKKEFVFYKDYADKSLTDIFDDAALKRARKLNFFQPRTSLLINNGASGFTIKPLPVEAQYAPVFGIEITDLDGDELEDIILAGNLFAVKPEVGRYDALRGLVLKNTGSANFKALTSIEAGVSINGEVRHIASLKNNNKKTIAFIRNNNTVLFYRATK
jgi:hypothetical protein